MRMIEWLGQSTGVEVPTTRYREGIVLLPEAKRSGGNHRLYSRRMQERRALVRHARDLGFPPGTIRDLPSRSGWPGQPCAGACAIASAEHQGVQARISRLLAPKAELQRMVTQCPGGRIAECHVIEVLGNHSRYTRNHRAYAQAPV